jgi:solute carrier family 35 protein C2
MPLRFFLKVISFLLHLNFLTSRRLHIFCYLIIFDRGLILYLAVAKETEFNLWGFIFIMLAAVMSGFRWSMTQILLQVCCRIMLSQFSYFILFKYCVIMVVYL